MTHTLVYVDGLRTLHVPVRMYGNVYSIAGRRWNNFEKRVRVRLGLSKIFENLVRRSVLALTFRYWGRTSTEFLTEKGQKVKFLIDKLGEVT